MTTTSPTISDLIDKRPLSWLQIRTILLCSLVVLVDGYDLQNLALAVPSLSKAWNISPGALSGVQMASLLGIGIGSGLLAPLGDRFGRKPIILIGLILVGVSSLLCAHASSVNELLILRLITGAGIGVCQSNATALTAEYAPLPRRAFLMTIMGVFVAVGALVAGSTAGLLMKAGGWQMLFYVGGYGPLIIAALFALSAPESIRLLMARNVSATSDQRVSKILKAIAPEVDPTTVKGDPKESATSKTVLQTLAEIVKRPYLERTLHFWALFALTSMLLYTLVSWLPALLGRSGWQAPHHGIITMQLGGIVGSFILAFAMDKGYIISTLISGYIVTAIGALLFLLLPDQGVNWYVLCALMGVGVSGGMMAVAALGAIFYPPAMRATGFGWAATAGRVASVAGVGLTGMILSSGMAPSQIFAWHAAPAALCVLVVISMRGVMKRLN
jgi:MFS transporter, AAHS family, 4-hydroxybenzoate transporter